MECASYVPSCSMENALSSISERILSKLDKQDVGRSTAKLCIVKVGKFFTFLLHKKVCHIVGLKADYGCSNVIETILG